MLPLHLCELVLCVEPFLRSHGEDFHLFLLCRIIYLEKSFVKGFLVLIDFRSRVIVELQAGIRLLFCLVSLQLLDRTLLLVILHGLLFLGNMFFNLPSVLAVFLIDLLDFFKTFYGRLMSGIHIVTIELVAGRVFRDELSLHLCRVVFLSLHFSLECFLPSLFTFFSSCFGRFGLF